MQRSRRKRHWAKNEQRCNNGDALMALVHSHKRVNATEKACNNDSEVQRRHGEKNSNNQRLTRLAL